ncbi:hypothetical protein D3C84_780770 [compost metagenome]
MIFFGLYLARVIGTKVLPKEPVPPVSRMDLLLNMGETLLEQMSFDGLGNPLAGEAIPLAEHPGEVFMAPLRVSAAIGNGAIQALGEIDLGLDEATGAALVQRQQLLGILGMHPLPLRHAR